ncbi:hypothetical protein DFH08DRAFT_953206 [Mycena albidolilacea]|uniref:Uncharacterized protein n=1 Tax=Mycena albidolilacea TaxID=1033008 RepID=A0AAD7AG56_9AGAR|nr:hypothetical protein DFH08DRAFT_953206 [Mycena albidolilacea]
MYTNGLLAVFSSFTGIDAASRIITCSMVFHLDALLEGHRTPRTDATVVEEPIECRVDVLLREGRGCESYIEHSLVPFQGVQFGDRQHQLPLPTTQDPNDVATFPTHMVEDMVNRISAGARVPSRTASSSPRELRSLRTSRLVGRLLHRARECPREPPAHRQGDTHHDTPVVHSLYFGPQHTLQFFAVVVRDRWEHRESRWPTVCCHVVQHDPYPIARFAATSFDTTPTPLHGGPTLVGLSVGCLSTLDMTLLTPSMARGVTMHRISLPPRIVVETRIVQTSSPARAASVDAGNTGYFRGLETGDVGDANGVSGGSMHSGGGAAGAKGAPSKKNKMLDTMPKGAVPQTFFVAQCF